MGWDFAASMGPSPSRPATPLLLTIQGVFKYYISIFITKLPLNKRGMLILKLVGIG